MAKKARRKLTEKELAQLEGFATIRLPMEQMAALFGMSKDTLEHLAKKDDAVRSAIELGRGKASHTARRTLFEMAVGRPASKDDKTGTITAAQAADFKALKFWCQTQEGFKITYGVEGQVGEGKDPNDMTDDELDRQIAKMNARLAGRRHAEPEED